MESTFWLKQAADKPLFPDLVWSRPENKRQAGKLLIIGGNAHGFAVPAEAYQIATQAGIGVVKVLLPDALQKVVGSSFEAAEFAPSTPSGSFSRQALAELLELGQWADVTLLAGELGRSSETSVLIESFLTKSSLPIAITRDAVDYFRDTPLALLNRTQTLIVCSLGQLQKLCQQAKSPTPITFGMDLLHLVEALHELTNKYPCHIIVKHLQNLLVASNGKVSSTKLSSPMPIWRVKIATHATVWWLQQPQNPFETLTTAVFSLMNTV